MPYSSGVLGAVAAQPLPALGRPDVVDPIARLERRGTFRQAQPRQLAACVDVHIRRDRLGRIECAGAHEQAVAGDDVIATPQSGAASFAEKHVVMMLATATHQPEGLWRDRT